MSPSAKRNTAVLESSNKFQNPNISNVIAPETSRSYGGSPSSPEDPKNKPEQTKKSRFSTRARIGALAAGVSIIGGAVAGGFIANSQPAPEAPGTSQTDNEPVQPPVEAPVEAPIDTATGPEAPLLTGEALSAAFLIPTGLSDEQLADTFIEKIEDWAQYGQSIDTQDTFFTEGTPYIVSQAQEAGTTIAGSLFVSGYENDERLSGIVTNLIDNNAAVTESWAKTFVQEGDENPFPYVNLEPFNQTVDLDNYTVITPADENGQVTLNIEFTQHTDIDNLANPDDPNTISPVEGNGFAKDGTQGSWNVTFVNENGSMRVAQMYTPTL